MSTQVALLSGTVREFAAKKVFLAGTRGGALAAVTNIAIYFAARAAGVPMIGKFDPNLAASVLPAPLPAIASLVPALVGSAVLLGMNAVFTRPSKWFVPTAVIFTVLSMGGPLSVGEASAATKGVLMLMHVVAAIFITRSLVKRGKA
jgi:Family of unknown function (DUF6069)